MWPQFQTQLPWWGWIVMAALPPAVLVLYFLKLKRRPVEVPSTYLWAKSIEDLHVNSLLQRLRQNLLLFLQLLLLALAILALIAPSWLGTQLTGERFIFLVDNSASMSATDVGPSRLAEAKKRVRELIEQLPPGAVAMLVSFAEGARVEQTFTDNRAELYRRLEQIQPTQQTTSILEALQVAAGLANPGRSAYDPTDEKVAEALPATLYILSDGKFPSPQAFALGNLTPKFLPIGKADVQNLAILAFSVRRNEEKPNQMQAFARVQNFSGEQIQTVASLLLDGEQIDAQQLTLAANSVQGLSFPLVDFDGGRLELRLKHEDPFPLDNAAWAAINPPRPGKVLLVTRGNEPLQLALGTERAALWTGISVQPVSFLDTEDYKRDASQGIYSLVIFDRCTPKDLPQANTWFIDALPPAGWSSMGEMANPPILDIDRSHPLLKLIELGDVLIASSRAQLKGPAGSRTLIDSPGGPLLTIAPRDGFQDLVQSFPLMADEGWGTNWPLRASFPTFVLNVVQQFAGGLDLLAVESVQPGKVVSLRQTEGPAKVSITAPDGKKLEVARNRRQTYDVTATEQAGLYTVNWPQGTPQFFAVNLFSSEESDLRPVEQLAFGPQTITSEKAGEQVARHQGWKYLLLLALVVLLVEWYIYNRRVYL